MKILVLPKDQHNLFLQEIYSCFGENIKLVHSEAIEPHNLETFDLIHIHWPEALSHWKIPSNTELHKIETRLAKAPRIICTRHNFKPHSSNHPNAEALYRITYKNAYGIIHLGEFSKEDYHKRYPEFSYNQRHIVIPHPLYTSYPNDISKEEARLQLKIPKNSKVILVFGNIRHEQEKIFALNVFRQLNYPRKLLLVNRMPAPNWYINRNFRGKHKLLKLESFFRKKLFSQFFFYCKIPNNEIQVYLNAADVVFLPRSKVLNSGIPFLGWSFKKVVVAPDCGNISEYMAKTGNPVYRQGNVYSAASALKKGLQMAEQGEGGKSFEKAALHFHPSQISKQTEQFLKEICAFQDPY